MRYFVIGYTARDGNKEFAGLQGYIIKWRRELPSYSEIRSECLGLANKLSPDCDFKYLNINFMQKLGKKDYNSLMEVE